MQPLFQQPFHIFRDSAMRAAQKAVEELPPEVLNDPALDGRLQKIANQFRLDVAQLQPDQRKGKRRTEVHSDIQYNRPVERKIDWIDVTIPFTGAAESFDIAPSSSNLMHGDRIIVNGNNLQVSFPDEDQLDQRVNEFIGRLSQNLDRLRAEADQMSNEMVALLRNVAENQRNALNTRKERDKTRSFPIE